MRALTLAGSLLVGAALAARLPAELAGLSRRDDATQACTDISISSNNGDRKVCIVIDSSGSMAESDPDDLRLAAGRALASFLVSNSEATGGKKADEVCVINFDDTAYLDYALGDPGNASNSFSSIGALGGTFIAGGVQMAIQQLTQGNSGTTSQRSAIVVFTDGEDYQTDELVGAINNATGLGIRVSFGFLDATASEQPTEVLQAVQNSRGVYATVVEAAGSQNFINYVLLNGLTYQDNAQGYDTQLLSGLAETHFLNGTASNTLKYQAAAGEDVNFAVTSISGDTLGLQVNMGGQSLATGSTASGTFSFDGTSTNLSVKAPSAGEMDLVVTGQSSSSINAQYSVITNSSVPIKNCTVAVTGSAGGGLSTGAKAGIGVGVAAIVGLGGLASYFMFKHFHPAAGGGSGSAPTMAGPHDVSQSAWGGTGAEKPLAHTGVYPVHPDPSGMAPAGGGHPVGAEGGAPGFGGGGSGTEGFHAIPSGGNEGLHAIPAGGTEGLHAIPAGDMGAGASAGAAPAAGTGGYAGVHGGPFAFVPPFVPPVKGSPGHGQGQNGGKNPSQYYDGSHPGLNQGGVQPNDTWYPDAAHPAGPGGGYQHPMMPVDGGSSSTTGMQPVGGHGYSYYGGHGADPTSHTDISSPSQGYTPSSTPFSAGPGGGTTPLGHGPPADYAPAPGGGPGAAQHVYVPAPLAVGPAGSRQRHHHHEWLAQWEPCGDGGCPLHQASHVCAEGYGCACTCREAECPLNR